MRGVCTMDKGRSSQLSWRPLLPMDGPSQGAKQKHTDIQCSSKTNWLWHTLDWKVIALFTLTFVLAKGTVILHSVFTNTHFVG